MGLNFYWNKKVVKCIGAWRQRNEVARLRNKCVMTCYLCPRPFGERVRERGYLGASHINRLAAFTLAEGATHVARWNNSRKIAFTLAEVLITLGIIGVVAAMTIPTLVANYQKKETVTALKKAYSQLSQAVKMSELENGDKEYWNYDLPAETFMNTYLKPFLKDVEQTNGFDIHKTINYKYLNGDRITESSVNDKNNSVIKLSDGTIIFVDGWSSGENIYRGILVDTNGFKKPNILGRDLFAFRITPSLGLTPSLEEVDREEALSDKLHMCSKSKSASKSGYACTLVIMMDGWEIKSDYPWR